ncbi:hypothetical protein SELMODRAFT_136972 [Selaginella moellendorffii]|uniref:Xyloglucan endotransglucosylase/hydrolase n=1 Tax=Selaginella moellendorffii TaxID=88036 RepID=D8TCT0_SELML|nr:probable xyloglucan endotransglucosylase/hydrolase protein 5 [Selaginella moellendorffii]EFJ05556.1 hypothetical protein SELMODRAFT_136972 [Selaginella moellendorffii]|eukprot:XP_002993371.1 probable xyloglucan endotransglucosylase/hydrolase protein 5 [Selaginella moellendorffii]
MGVHDTVFVSATTAVLLVLMIQSSLAARLPIKSDVPFAQNYYVRWADDHTRMLNGGTEMHLVLDKASGAGFGSRTKYLFGHVSMKIKLVPKDSAGTVTAFYMSSETDKHDELDFEFLGNTSGQPYIVQTNVFANGVGNREQRHYLWFDPTQDFHSYSFLWNKQQIIFYVDDVPLRVHKNNEAIGIPFPKSQPMGIYSSLWNGDDWATRGGLEKINWDHAPFVAAYKGFSVDACAGGVESCSAPRGNWWEQEAFQSTDEETKSKLKWVKDNYMIYDYCSDGKRFPTTPADCGQF